MNNLGTSGSALLFAVFAAVPCAGGTLSGPGVNSGSAATSQTIAVAANASSATLQSAVPNYPFLRPPSPHPWVRRPDGVWIQDVVAGSGKSPSRGVAVYLEIRGYLADGTAFFDTYKRKKWYVYTYGDGSVMKSLEEAIATMREGGKRRVVIPPELAYGPHGYKPDESEGTVAIPPNATLVYEITLLWIRAPEPEKLNKFK